MNGDYLDKGNTKKRHIFIYAVRYIGKEANKWEEQYYTGLDIDEMIEYGSCEKTIRMIKSAIERHGMSKLARTSRLSVRYVYDIYYGKATASNKSLMKLLRASIFLDEYLHDACSF